MDGEHKPLLALQQSVPEQAAPSCLEFPGMSIVSQSHHRSWEARKDGEDVGSGPRLPCVSAVDAGNEHGTETGGALLSLTGAAGDDHGAQFLYISCMLIRLNAIQASVYLSGLITTKLETLEC